MMDDKVFRRMQDTLSIYAEVYRALSMGRPSPDTRENLQKLNDLITPMIKHLHENAKGQY